MNNKAWITASVFATVVAIGLGVVGAAVISSPPEAVWSGKVDQLDPRDINRAEAIAHHARWAASVKAEKERIAAEEKRKADEAERVRQEEARKASQVAQQPTTPTRVAPRPTAVAPPVQKPVQPAPQGDAWMNAFNHYRSQLPGTYIVQDMGSYGAAQLDDGTVYIARRTPLNLLWSVMAHESCHVRQGRAFNGYYGAVQALAPYGGIERTADACAANMGATWFHYGITPAARQGAQLF